MEKSMTNAAKLRKCFAEQNPFVVPGSFDVFSAQLIEHVGFPAVYLSGYGVNASCTGRPDWGFMTMTEILNTARNIVDAVDIPLISDIDQGFGALHNFVRTIHAFENAGVAGVHFEDQQFPKKCAGMHGRPVIPLEQMVAKIHAAIETRDDPDFVLIARTDSKETEGMDGVKRRMAAYLDAGADYLIFCEHETMDELYEIGREFPGKVIPFIGDIPDSNPWPTFYHPAEDYVKMGYAAMFYCTLGISTAHKAMRRSYEELFNKKQISKEFAHANLMPLTENNKVLKIDQYEALRTKYNML